MERSKSGVKPASSRRTNRPGSQSDVLGEFGLLLDGVGGEAAELVGASLELVWFADAIDVEEHGVDAAGQLGDFGGAGAVGGFAGGFELGAETAHGGADAGSVGDGEIDHFAVDLNGAVLDFGSDLAVEVGGDVGDFGEAEIAFTELLEALDERLGIRAGDAGVLDAVLVPAYTEPFVRAAVFDLTQGQSLSRGSIAGDNGERLLAPDPGAGFEELLGRSFHDFAL